MDDETLDRMRRQREADIEQKTTERRYTEPGASWSRSHEDVVERRLGWIVGGVWVVAGAVLVNVIIGMIVGAASGPVTS
jgi:hypothetical protein